MAPFKELLSRLKRQHGILEPPPARGPFELVMWENACYLLPEERRAEVFEALRVQVGMNPHAILNAGGEKLLTLAKRGGMRPEVRVFRWREIARITVSQFAGDLSRILNEPYDKAKRALKQFPTIGDPGAEKILLFCGMARGLPLESNGLRVLTRVGYGRTQKSYGATYKSVQEAIGPELPRDAASLMRAHLLLRQHGRQVCTNNAPACAECKAAEVCAFFATASRGALSRPC